MKLKRYYFAPSTVQSYRSSGLKACIKRGAHAFKNVLRAILSNEPVDSLSHFVLVVAAVVAMACCIGMVAGCIDIALASGGI